MFVEAKKDWSFGEWISNFLEDPHPYYHGTDDDYDDPLPDGMPGGDDDYYDDLDESIIESIVIVGLAAALAFLVYYRQQRQNTHRQEVERQAQPAPQQNIVAPEEPLPGQQPDGGFFPPADDPNFGPWVAGGVGH